MQKWWVWISLTVVSVLLVFVGVYVYRFAGLEQFWRAKRLIDQFPSQEEQEQTWSEFRGYDSERIYGGILAGSALGRVWVWGVEGLQSFVVDENSVYSWYDGCNPEVLARLNVGEAGVIEREIDTDLYSWRQKAKVGDYVRVFITTPEMGGKEGDLREIYTYNFWLFLQRGMEERCAK